MKLGFDQVYVVAKNDTTIEYQCIYDNITADERVEYLKSKGYDRAEKITLEYAFENHYLIG